MCIGITTLAYGHKDIKRIEPQRHDLSTCESAAAADEEQLEEGDGAATAEGMEIAETEQQVDELTERIYYKIQSIPICYNKKEPMFEAVERRSGGRITPLDCEKFLELLNDKSRFTLDIVNTLKMRIKNLLMFRKKDK